MSYLLISMLAAASSLPAFAAETAEEAPGAVAAACAVSEDESKPLLGCAQHLDQVTQGYERALQEWKAFSRSASNRLASVAEKEKKAKTQIQANSAEINKLKFKKNRKNKRLIKDLERDNKQLWKSLKAIEKEQASLCRDLAKEGADKQDQLSDKIADLWKSARNALR